jgi:hypothetical protein
VPLRPRTREQMLAATPECYLAEGWSDSRGQPWPELRAEWASAVAQQWFAGQVAVQEVEITFEAFTQVSPYYGEQVAARITDLAAECLALARGVMGQPNNPAFVNWMDACLRHVHQPADGEAFMVHFKSALLQYALRAKEKRRRG